MKQAPNVWTLNQLKRHIDVCKTLTKNKKWIPERPKIKCSLKDRFKISFKVFLGQLDAIDWNNE